MKMEGGDHIAEVYVHVTSLLVFKANQKSAVADAGQHMLQ